jgi:uncharacterized protein YfaP (DUF2135 family)
MSVRILLLLSLLVSACSSTPETPADDPHDVNVARGPVTIVKTQTIDDNGGVLSVTEDGPLKGLRIEFPARAVRRDTEIRVGWANLSPESKFPADTRALGKLMVFESSSELDFERPVFVTAPYDTGRIAHGDFLMAYEVTRVTLQGNSIGRFVETSTVKRDAEAGTITFAVRHFSDYLIVEWAKKAADILSTSADFNVHTGFSPKSDGWFITNYGSILNPGGNCIGMSSYARWYYSFAKPLLGERALYSKYRQGDVTKWEDDEIAVEAASRMQLGESVIWNQSSAEMTQLQPSSLDVAKSFVQAMVNTGAPQILYISQKFPNGTYGGAHAVLIYGYRNGSFLIYDPNHPGVERSVDYTYGSSWAIYNSGTSAKVGKYNYNIFWHVGPGLYHGFGDALSIYLAAEGGFTDSKFPTVTLETPTDVDDDGKRDVMVGDGEQGVVLEGVIAGGEKKAKHTIIYVNGTPYQVALDDEGKFSQFVSLYCTNVDSEEGTQGLEQKDNVVEFLVTEENAWQNYAGYERFVVNCTGLTPMANVTLTWSTGLDIDLHVIAPDGSDIGYRGINYQGNYNHAYPYLDHDDLYSTGPEHIHFPLDNDMEPGTYTVWLEYYSAHGADPIPEVAWSVIIENGYMVNGVPTYFAPAAYHGWLASEKETVTVGSFEFAPEVPREVLAGAQDQ